MFFCLVSVFSGNAVTGQSAGISGRVTLDGGAQAVVAGAIDEPGGGQYRLLPFASDTNGDTLGFFFTASGCAPVSLTVSTQNNVSGRIFTGSGLTWLASGSVFLASGSVTSGTITSGSVFIASGPFVVASVSIASGTLYPASGSVFLASGSITSGLIASGTVFIASGANVVPNIASGTLYLASGSIASGTVFIASGAFVNVGASITSGTIYLASGSIAMSTFASGVVGGGSGNIPSSWGNSGAVTVGQNLDKSGYSITTIFDKTGYSLLSGTTFLASGLPGYSGTVQIASGSFTVATTISGTTFLASGSATALLSGCVSGQPVSLLSGTTFLASGSITSGLIASGTVFIASGPFAVTSIASGTTFLASGSATALLSGCASGQLISLLSGQSVITAINQDKSGYSLTANFDKTDYTILSGTTFLASGLPGYSGTLYLASGPLVNISSGNTVSLYSGSLSGQVVSTLSGQTFIASGPFTVASVSISSGTTYLASGSAVSLYSGQNVVTAVNLDKSGYQLVDGSLRSGTFASGVVDVNIPDAMYRRDMALVSGEAARSLLNATRKLMNRWDTTTTSGVLTVYREDDTTISYTQNIASMSGAQPITSLDTN